MKRVRGIFRVGIGLGCVWLLLTPSQAFRIEGRRALLAVEVLVEGLDGPGGLAVDARRDILYVAERDADRVVAVRGRTPHACIERFAVSPEHPAWAHAYNGVWRLPVFDGPDYVAVDADGALYVGESGAAGRLLRFGSLDDGLLLADAVFTPADRSGGHCSALCADTLGRLFVALRDGDDRAMLTGATLMMRDASNDWWVVDYGAFEDFNGLAVDPDGTMLMVAEHRGGEIAWYDTARQAVLGEMEGLGDVRHVAVLPDGVCLCGRRMPDGAWTVAEPDPVEWGLWPWVSDLPEIGGLAVHPVSGDVYVSLRKQGRILRIRRVDDYAVRPDEAWGHRDTDKRLKSSLSPARWPRFLADFIAGLGVIEPRDVVQAENVKETVWTLDRFTDAMPLIAAKLKAIPEDGSDPADDPLEELHLVLFYPDRENLPLQASSPSISLFRAIRRSGTSEHTRFLGADMGSWIRRAGKSKSNEVALALPTGYLGSDEQELRDGILRMYFLGMGLGHDYWITLDRHARANNRLVIERVDGGRETYRLVPFQEQLNAGGESILVAGMKRYPSGWHGVGQGTLASCWVDPGRDQVRCKHARRPRQEAEALGEAVELRDEARFDPETMGLCREILSRAAGMWAKASF